MIMLRRSRPIVDKARQYCRVAPVCSTETSDLISASDEQTVKDINTSFTIVPNFISEKEENCLFEEANRYVRKLRYEYDHWDNAIHGVRETEKSDWSDENNIVLQRLRELAFRNTSSMAFVHILDLAKNGYIKPHIDSVRFCGDTIAGVCLLSPCVMRLVHDKEKSRWADCFIDRRSLYIMKGASRYEYTHEVLKEEESVFKGLKVPRDRRISIICRNKPNELNS